MGHYYKIVVELDQTSLSDTVTEKNLKDWRLSDIWSSSDIDSLRKNSDTFEKMTILKEKGLMVSNYLGHGIIRLYKVDSLQNDTDEECTNADDMVVIPGDDTMVCIVFVPTYFTVHELLNFYIGSDVVNNQISNFRILQNKNNELGFSFMVLIKFRESIRAKQFKEEYNGKRFNKMDSETCHVISIKEVIFDNTLFNRQGTEEDLPYLLTDPFTTVNDCINEKTFKKTELPTCPVCLERMDSKSSGLITIPCQHTFHCQCLNKWKNSNCPVCRNISLRLTRDTLTKQSRSSSHCSSCNSVDNLWICLICGNVGCGRYNFRHAIQHFEETSHCFSMDMCTQRVWDYAGDNYVHRLVQNEVDGKLVDVGSNILTSNEQGIRPGNNDKDACLADSYVRNKEYHLEYVQVLLSQLESQREYYEIKLSRQNENVTQKKEQELIRKELDELKLSFKEVDKNHINEEKTLLKQIEEDDMMISGLQENLDHSEEKHKLLIEENNSLTSQILDLKEQVQDLMFYLASQDKFKDADESIKEGTIVIQNQNKPPISENLKSKKKSKTKKKQNG